MSCIDPISALENAVASQKRVQVVHLRIRCAAKKKTSRYTSVTLIRFPPFGTVQNFLLVFIQLQRRLQHNST